MNLKKMVARRIGSVFDNVAEEIGVSVATGVGVLGLSLLALGLAGLLRTLPIAALFLLFLAVSARSGGGLIQAFLREYRSIVATRARGCATILMAFCRAVDPPRIYPTSFKRARLSRLRQLGGKHAIPCPDDLRRVSQLLTTDRVLMIGAQMCYDMRREYIADVNWNTTEWPRLLARNSSMDDLNTELKNRGITHVLFSPSLFEFSAQMGRQGLPEASGPVRTSGPDYGPQLMTLATFAFYRTKIPR